MKKKLFYQLSLLFSTSIILLASCSKNDDNIESDSMQDLISIKEKVARLGFDTTGIIIDEELILVEGDIVLTKSELTRTSPRHASSVNIANGVYPISYSRHRNLKYHISSTVSSWESAIQAAFSQYNTLSNFNLRFTRTTNVSEADLRIESGVDFSDAAAEARFPANGQIGVRIGINLSVPNLNESQRTFLMVHEIGHTIGMRHTDWRGSEFEHGNLNGIPVGAYTIPGTPNNSSNPDPNSIFNSGRVHTGVPNWTNFSSLDLVALRTVYPSYGPAQLTTSPDGSLPAYVGMNILAHVDVHHWREGGLTYEWFVQGATIVSTSGNSMQATVTDPNSAGVYCTIRNAHGEAIAVSRSFGPIEID